MLRSVAQWPAAIVSDGFSFEKKLNGFRFETHEPVIMGSIWMLIILMIIYRLFTMILTHYFFNQTKISSYNVTGFAIVARQIVTETIWYTKVGDDMPHFSFWMNIASISSQITYQIFSKILICSYENPTNASS